MNVFPVNGTPLQKLPYINVSFPLPTKLGFDEVNSGNFSRETATLISCDCSAACTSYVWLRASRSMFYAI